MDSLDFREVLEECLRNNDLTILNQLRSYYKLTTVHRYTYSSGDMTFSIRTVDGWHYHVTVGLALLPDVYLILGS